MREQSAAYLRKNHRIGSLNSSGARTILLVRFAKTRPKQEDGTQTRTVASEPMKRVKAPAQGRRSTARLARSAATDRSRKIVEM